MVTKSDNLRDLNQSMFSKVDAKENNDVEATEEIS